MDSITINLDESLKKALKEIEKKENISIQEFIASAIREKIDIFMSSDYISNRAKGASKEKFEQAMLTIPETEPDEFDRL